MRTIPALLALVAAATPVLAQRTESDFVTKNFRFQSGEVLPELRIHYTTLGAPRKNASGAIDNAVLMLHGTGGSGTGLVRPMSPLFAPGDLLDTTKFFVIFPDNVGHGKSSKPSDGMHMRFPKYTYDDMVDAQHALLVDGLHVNHLHLVMGTSMGCMHSWVWAERYPTFIDGAVPLACAPTAIVGRNRMVREMIIQDIENDPDWKGGEYASEPVHGLRSAMGVLFIMTSAPLVQMKQAPTREKADSMITEYMDRQTRAFDANDVIYQFDASRLYDPSSKLETVIVPVLQINSMDDFVNPPELGVVEKLMPRVKHGRFVLIPISDKTRGHGTHSIPAVWHDYLAAFLRTLPPVQSASK